MYGQHQYFRCRRIVQQDYGAPCALGEHHQGPCHSDRQLNEEARRGTSPTLEDIRRVVPEEIESAFRAPKPSPLRVRCSLNLYLSALITVVMT